MNCVLPVATSFAAAMLVLVASAGSGQAENFWMNEADLRQSFTDATIDGQYSDERTFREHYKADGSLKYTESVRNHKWQGHWSVVRDRFCTIYDNFGTGGCFRVHRKSLNCFEFYFDTRTEEEARRSTLRKPSWTARAWRVDAPSTCQERPLV